MPVEAEDGTSESPAGDPSARWGAPRWVVGLLLLVAIVPVAFAAYWAYQVRSTWHTIDSSAEAFEVPAVFDEVATLRLGSAFCVVTCSRELPQVVVVMTWDGESGEGCDRLAAALEDVVPRAEPRSGPWECGYSGEIEAPVAGVAAMEVPARIETFGPNDVYADDWANEIGVPEARYVAWARFVGRIE